MDKKVRINSKDIRGEIALGSILVFGLLMLGSAVVIGGQNFLKTFNADDRSRAGGIACGGGECNDGFTYGQDCSAPQTSCVQRNNEACASHGGHKSGGGPITCGGGTTTAPTSSGGGGTPTCQSGSHKECVGKPIGPLSISGSAGECFKNSGTNAAPVCGWRFTGVDCLNDGALRPLGNEPCCTGKTYTAADGKKYCGSPSSTGTPVPTNSSGQCGTGYVKCSFSDCANATGCMPNTKTCNQWKAEKCPVGTPTATATQSLSVTPTLRPAALRCNVAGTNVGNCVSETKEVGASCTNGIGNQTGLVCNMTASSIVGGNVTCSCGLPIGTPTPSPTGPFRCTGGFNPGNCISSLKNVGDACISNTNQNGVCTQNSSSGTTANCTCQNSTSSSLTCTGGIAVGATRCDPRGQTILNYCRRPGGNQIGFAGGDNDMWEMQYCPSGKICQNGSCVNIASGTTHTRACDANLSETSCKSVYGDGVQSDFIFINESCGTSGGQCLSRGVVQSTLNEGGLAELHNCYCSSGNQTTCVSDSECGGGVCRKIGTGSSPFICVPNEGFRCPSSSNTLTTGSTTSVSNAYLCYIERGDTNLLWKCNDGYVPNSSRTNCVLSAATATPTPTATQRVTATASPSPTPTATRVATPNTTLTPQFTPVDGSVPTLSPTSGSTPTATPTPTSSPGNCDSTLWFPPLWRLCIGMRAVQTAFAPPVTPTPVATSASAFTCDVDSDCAGGYCGYPYPGAANKACLSDPMPLVTPVPNTSITPSPLPRACSPSSRLECCGQGIARSIEVMCTTNGSQVVYGECFPGYEEECGAPAPTERTTISCPFGTFDNLNTGTCDPITCAEGYTFNAANGTCVAIAGTGVRSTCDNSVSLNRTACNSSDNLYQYRCINPGGDSLTQWRRERCNEGLMCSGDRCR